MSSQIRREKVQGYILATCPHRNPNLYPFQESVCVPLDVQGHVLSGEPVVSRHGPLDTLTAGMGGEWSEPVIINAIITITIIVCGK